MGLCSWKDRKTIVAGLRRVYTAVNAEAAAEALDELEEQWGNRYPDASVMLLFLSNREHPRYSQGFVG